MGRKLGGLLPFLGPELGPIKHNVARANVYLGTKWHLDPSSRLATTDMGRKLAGFAFFGGRGGMGPHLTQCGLAEA